jgi:hypothetical protein
VKQPKISKPCKKCPYKLGLVKYIVNPCAANCTKENSYKLYYETLSKIKPTEKLMK